MTEDLQSVIEPKPWHPDADQLNAFAEQALPAQERERTLAHLAACEACRETIFLAQQATPEVPQAAPARRPWFAGWNLVWPAVTALAAVAGFSVYLRHGARVERPAPTVTVAVARPEQALPAAERKPAPDETQPAPARKSPHSASAAVVAEKTPFRPLIDAPPLPFAPPSQSNNALAPPKPAIAVFGAAGMGTGAGVGDAQTTQRAAAPVNMPPQSQTAFAADGISPPSQAARQAAQPQMQMQALQAAPPPPAPPPGQQQQHSETVMVEASAASLSDIPATSDTSAKFAALLPELPSHQETVSSISNGMATVAVDAGGAVFESRDDGKHWKTVEAPWSGRPVKVALEESRTAKKRAAFRAAPIADDSLDRRPSGAAGEAELRGTVTDQTGAVIPGASIQVRVAGTAGDRRTVQADSQGRFTVQGLAAGRYEVVVSSPGFATLTRVLSLDAGVETGMNATLVVGAATETVTVESDAPVKPAAKPPAFQLTTDTGAVWVSSDGRSWKKR